MNLGWDGDVERSGSGCPHFERNGSISRTSRGYVAWWVSADHAMDWAEGSERLDRLYRDGPTALAFNFARERLCA